ncbi:MAG: RHS repeat-associated core domain-containing protein [Acidobacteriota bacterium]
MADHLGSTRLVTKADGTVRGRHDYLPFGEEIGTSYGGRSAIAGYGATDLRHKFTAKERDPESNLDYFGARYFSGAQGRFTSADGFDYDSVLSDPQSWNKYAYVRNNPLRYVDPNGRKCISLDNGTTADDGDGTPCAEVDAGDERNRTIEPSVTVTAPDPFALGNRNDFLIGAGKEIANAGIDILNIIPSGLNDPELRRRFEIPRFETTNLNQKGGSLLASLLMLAVPGPEGKTVLYRAVGMAEFEQVMKTGKFLAGPNSLGGKFFAESFADAGKWGNLLEGAGNFRVLEVTVPTSEASKFMRWERLDGIGPARYGNLEQLSNAVIRPLEK